MTALLLAWVAPATLTAQERSWEIVFENDVLTTVLPGRLNSDREYTHGLWLAVERDGSPLWGRVLADLPDCGPSTPELGACTRTRFEVGHEIFTPDFHNHRDLTMQRPYAALLFGSMTARVLAPSIARSLRVELGVTGPPALGEEFQQMVHRLMSFREPEGWDEQVSSVPAVLLQFQEDRVFDLLDEGIRVADVIPSWQATVGNIRSGAQLGVVGRAGTILPHPWGRGAGVDESTAFGFVGIRQSWIAHDLFLDGETMVDREEVERRPFVAELETGGAVQIDGVRLTTALVIEQRRYETQPEPHWYVRAVLGYYP
ncbi:MAG: lipid A deacylase LpxR family protein [Gemmatimonadota bacterium]